MLGPAYRIYALVTLTAVYMLNLTDRALMGLLLQPIKEDLGLSDTQLGFLTGIAFAIFYAILGVPIARLADRRNRVTISAAAIALWGVTVMACLFVTSYVQLVLARIAAAVGEAGCKPPTYSLVGDYFPQASERTRAMAVYWLGSPLAVLITFVGGGWLNERYGWRLTFFLMGIPGVMLALLVKSTIIEPRTRDAGFRHLERPNPSIKQVLTILWHQQSFRHLAIALVLFYSMSFGLWPWFAAFMMRSHGMGTAEVGRWMGVVLGIGGIAGTLLGGYVVARWFSHDERAQMRMTAITMASLVPLFVAFLTLPQKHQALIAFVPLMTTLSIFIAPTYALMQRLVPDEIRATALALLMLLANLVGMGVGPQVVGIVSDLLMPSMGADSLRYAMLLMSTIAWWAAFHFWRVGRTVAGDISAVAGYAQHSNTVLLETIAKPVTDPAPSHK